MENRERYRYTVTDLEGKVVMENVTAAEIANKYFLTVNAVKRDARVNALMLNEYRVTRVQVIFPERFTLINIDTGETLIANATAEKISDMLHLSTPNSVWNSARRGHIIHKHYKVVRES